MLCDLEIKKQTNEGEKMELKPENWGAEEETGS